MLRIAICDDMPDFLSQAREMIIQWPGRPKYMTIETYEDADSLLSAHNHVPFHIIILDVIMPLLNGIEAARELRQADPNVKIIFLTTSSEFAVESYTVKANNYLLKPIKLDTLYHCLDELQAEMQAEAKYITVKGIHAVHRIPIQNIEYIESQNKQLLFFLTNGSAFLTSEPLYSFDDKLLLSDGFFRCHRSYIVNMYQIETYTQKEIKMRGGCRIPISRSSHKEFETAYFKLLFGKAGDF